MAPETYVGTEVRGLYCCRHLCTDTVWDNIQVTVAVHIDRKDRGGSIDQRRDDALREGLGPVVVVPRDSVVIPRPVSYTHLTLPTIYSV